MRFYVIIFSLVFTSYLTGQDNLDFEFSYDVQQVYEPLSLSRDQASTAETVFDLNQFYKPSWVKEFISVNVSCVSNGKVKSATSKNDNLSQDQKELINAADIGSKIEVVVNYIPDNNLKNNEPKVYDFAFRVNPEHAARYKEGEQSMMQHIKEHAIEKLKLTKFQQYHLSAVKFSIDELGQVTDAHIFESSRDEEVDAILLNAVCSMPDWIPAKYADGSSTNQEFVLRAGDMNSCVVNLLNTREN